LAVGAFDRELEPGQTVGEYRIEAKIGEGGFGSVYRAVHPLIGKTAAIKVLSRQYSSNPQVVSRFVAEARAVNQIRHRNIIDIFAFGTLDDGRQYFVMELLEGMPLDRYLSEEKGRLTPEEAIPILRAVGRALDAAHASGILHRDLKPENIFLSFDEDGHPFPKLLDFGIAKLMGGSDGGKSPNLRTRTGTPMGTPFYMSPEQCRGKSIDHRSDIYSFGVLCHELLTGQVPFDGEDVMDLLMKQTSAPAPPMSSMCKAIPATLDAPVLKMLEKDPDARPATVGAAVEGIAKAANEAGFAVSLPIPSGSVPAVRTTPGGHHTLGNVATLSEPPAASAATPSDRKPSAHTFGAAASDVRAGHAPPATGRRARVGIGVLGAAVLVAAVAAIGVARTGTTGAAGRAGGGSSASASASAAPISETTLPALTPTAPTEAKEVSVTIQSTPSRASIWKEGEKLGEAPGPIVLARGQQGRPTKLVIKSDGYKASEVEVDTSKDSTVVVSLGKAERPAHDASKARRAGQSKGEIPTDINEK